MKEILEKENKQISEYFEKIENMYNEFSDKEYFQTLLTEMTEVYHKRYIFMESLIQYKGTETEEEATKKLEEIIEGNKALFLKWKNYFIEKKNIFLVKE